MLTKNDLQEIKSIVDTSVDTKLKPVKKQLNKMQKRLTYGNCSL